MYECLDTFSVKTDDFMTLYFCVEGNYNPEKILDFLIFIQVKSHGGDKQFY